MADKREGKQMLVRLPISLHRQLEQRAFEESAAQGRRVSMTELVVDALTTHLDAGDTGAQISDRVAVKKKRGKK